MLGLDSIDPFLAQLWMDEGRLPVLAELAERGRCALVTNPFTYFSGAAWPTLITGVSPWVHGTIFDRQLKPGSHSVEHVTARSIGAPPFWRYVSDAGLRSTVVGVYAQSMLEGFRGTQVIAWGSHDPFSAKFGRPRSDPPEVLSWLEQGVPDRRYGFRDSTPRTLEELRTYAGEALTEIDKHGRGLQLLLERTEWDLFLGCFSEPHEAGHHLWHLWEPESEDDVADADPELRGSLRAIYERVDRALGAVIARVPPDAAVMAFTPHGMYPNWRMAGLCAPLLEAGGWCVRLGEPMVKDPRLKVMSSLRGAAHAVLPRRARHVLGRAFRKPRSKLLAGLELADIDWSLTRAFSLPNDGASIIRVNLRGREPSGVVRPGSEYDALLEEISIAAGELVDEQGRPVVSEILQIRDLLGEVPGEAFPDLAIVWADRRIRTVSSERLGTLEVPFDKRSGDHRRMGFVVGAGPGIESSGERRIEGPEATILDVAPTALARLGVPIPSDLSGKPIPGLAQPGLTTP